MDSENLFWNVDTQVDFVEPTGKLYVSGAELLKEKWAAITQFASENEIRVINTADYHKITSEELSANPDFVHSFPQHCMGGTIGAEYIDETNPECPLLFDWDKHYPLFPDHEQLLKARNILIRKDNFDVFLGNENTEELLRIINPKKIFVYGVTTNVCVDRAVVGLAERGFKVYVFEDAIKELPNIPIPFENWDKLGINRISFEKVKDFLL
ncbi:cysteine hydrolase [Prolixibacteraceae bacterium JC049]|nr:cysteine hydrolase [Prolixibacteraceae bacterium JC049]